MFSTFADTLTTQSGVAGVRLKGIIESAAPLQMQYRPNHPQADANGNVYPCCVVDGEDRRASGDGTVVDRRPIDGRREPSAGGRPSAELFRIFGAETVLYHHQPGAAPREA